MSILVSVVMPLYNEEKYIENTIATLKNQNFNHDQIEWIFVDGMSLDNTRKLLLDATKDMKHVEILDNLKRNIPCALNMGIQRAQGKYIVRMDAHSVYKEDYIQTAVSLLEQDIADIVGGASVAQGVTDVQKAISAAFVSPFALGSFHHHDENFTGYTGAVTYGSYKKAFAVQLGLYDETLEKSEDDDFYFRARKNGAKIYCTPKLKIQYFPRDTFAKLFEQYEQFGYWKFAFYQKHRQILSVLQVLPFLFVLGNVMMVILSFIPFLRDLYAGCLALYILLDAVFSITNKKANSLKLKGLLFVTHIIMHVSYGIGGIRRALSCKK